MSAFHLNKPDSTAVFDCGRISAETARNCFGFQCICLILQGQIFFLYSFDVFRVKHDSCFLLIQDHTLVHC